MGMSQAKNVLFITIPSILITSLNRASLGVQYHLLAGHIHQFLLMDLSLTRTNLRIIPKLSKPPIKGHIC